MMICTLKFQQHRLFCTGILVLILLLDYFNSYACACSLEITVQTKMTEEHSLVFSAFHVDGLVSNFSFRKVQDYIKTKKIKDLDDLMCFLNLFCNLEVNLCIYL